MNLSEYTRATSLPYSSLLKELNIWGKLFSSRQLAFNMQMQTESNWCWAAASTSASHFYWWLSTWTQCRVANAELGHNDCCNSSVPSACNVPWFLDRALTRTNNFVSMMGQVSFQQVKNEIDAGRPVGARIGWNGGGGHFMMIYGYSRILSTEYFDIDVTGMSVQTINTKAKHVPGLNYSTKLSVEGETGYIDAKGDYHNPDFPVTREGPLPGVAIILGSGAFSWGSKPSPRPKAFALATMRHEMMHGIQEQLAIGWLLKWRDEFTGRSFSNWLTEERKQNRISAADFAVVSSGISPFDLAAIEVLAWTEGFVAALPFLPGQPQFSQMMPKETWPGAISGLRGAGDFYNKMSSKTDGAEIRKAALDRIHRVICNDPTQNQRNALKVWIPFLLDPGSLNPTTDSDKEAVKLINGFFTPLKDFLKAVLASTTKPCPK